MSAGNGLRRWCLYCGASGPVEATECPRCRGAGLYRQTTDLTGAAAVETPGGQLFAALDPLQVARAVLVDATRDPDTARRWAASYASVTGDPDAWPIPVVAVRAWVRAMAADLATVTPEELGAAAEAWDRATMEGGAECMTATEVLRRARALIEEPARWCRDKYARDERGRSIRPGSARACQWCALGAVRAVTSGIPANDVQPIYREAIRRLQRALNPDAPGAQSGIVDANDRTATTHADVLAAFDVAIEGAT